MLNISNPFEIEHGNRQGEVLSRGHSLDKSVRPVQYPQPINARQFGNLPIANTERENQVASEANAAGMPSVDISNDGLQMSLEVVAIILLNRARIQLMLNNRSGARQCFDDALECSRFSHNQNLQRKCREWLLQFQEGLGVCNPLMARTMLNRTFPIKDDFQLSTPASAPSKLQNDHGGKISQPFLDEHTPVNGGLSPPTPQNVLLDGKHTPDLNSLPLSALRMVQAEWDKRPGEVDRVNAQVRNEPARRHLLQSQTISASQHYDSARRNKRAAASIEPKMSSIDIKNVQESTIALRRRGARHPSLQPQARASARTPTEHQPRSPSANENVTTVGPLPQRRQSLTRKPSNPAINGNADNILSTDTPSLTKLSETISANPSPHSKSSAETARLWRPLLSAPHPRPPLAIQTSGTDAASSLDSTAPHNHSPLREAFFPEPDPVDGIASYSDTLVGLSTDPHASGRTPIEENHEPPSHNRDALRNLQIDDSAAITRIPVASDGRSLANQSNHMNSDETVTEQAHPEAETIMKSALNRSSQDVLKADPSYPGIRAGAVAKFQVKQKIAKMQTDKQKESNEPGKPGELRNELNGTSTSTTDMPITPSHDPPASDKIVIDGARDSALNDTSHFGDTAVEPDQVIDPQSIEDSSTAPLDSYGNIDPNETMTEQDRLDAERVLNVVLHGVVLDVARLDRESIFNAGLQRVVLNIAPETVLDEYTKYQVKQDLGTMSANQDWHQQYELNKAELRKKLPVGPDTRHQTEAKETHEDDVS